MSFGFVGLLQAHNTQCPFLMPRGTRLTTIRFAEAIAMVGLAENFLMQEPQQNP